MLRQNFFHDQRSGHAFQNQVADREGPEDAVFHDEKVAAGSFRHLVVPNLDGFVTTGFFCLLFAENVAQQIQRLDVAAQPTFIRNRNHAHARLPLFRFEIAWPDGHRQTGNHLIRKSMTARRPAPGNLQIDPAVLDSAFGNQAFMNVGHLVERKYRRNLQFAQRTVQAVDMRFQRKALAIVDLGVLIHAIAKLITAIFHRNDQFLQIHRPPVDIPQCSHVCFLLHFIAKIVYDSYIIPYGSSFAAASTASACPSILTLRQTAATIPARSIKNVDRSIPRTFFPYMFFSLITSYIVQTLLSTSASNGNGNPSSLRMNFSWDFKSSRLTPNTTTSNAASSSWIPRNSRASSVQPAVESFG